MPPPVSPLATSYRARAHYQIQEIYTDIKHVFNSVSFCHVQIHVTNTTFKTQNCPVTTEISLVLSLYTHTTPIATELFSFLIITSFQECHINRMIQYVIFRDWLFPLSKVSLRSLYVVAYINSSFLFIDEYYPLGGYTTSLLSNLFTQSQLTD